MKLIDNWKAAHKFASVRLAALAAVAGAYFTAFPAQLETLLDAVPEAYRGPVGVLVGLVIFATAAGARVASFNKDADHAG